MCSLLFLNGLLDALPLGLVGQNNVETTSISLWREERIPSTCRAWPSALKARSRSNLSTSWRWYSPHARGVVHPPGGARNPADQSFLKNVRRLPLLLGALAFGRRWCPPYLLLAAAVALMLLLAPDAYTALGVTFGVVWLAVLASYKKRDSLRSQTIQLG